MACVLGLLTAGHASAQVYDLPWSTLDCGGGTSTGGSYEVSSTIGQPDAGGPMIGGAFEVTGGFWAGITPAGTGAPAATLTSAVSRKANSAGPGGVCDLPLIPARKSEPRRTGISQLRLNFDIAPGGPGVNPVTLEQATCAAPAFVPYNGASTLSASLAGNELVLTFTPDLENARTYRIALGPEVTSIPNQTVEVRGLVGDVNSDSIVNAVDRSAVVGVWTGAGFSCTSDLNSDTDTNAVDRSIVVAGWTSGQNCAP
jgi:hypothetical protein